MYRPARGGRLCERFGGYKTINRIPLPLPLSYCLLCDENDGNLVVLMHMTFLSKKHKLSSRKILLNSSLLEDDSGL